MRCADFCCRISQLSITIACWLAMWSAFPPGYACCSRAESSISTCSWNRHTHGETANSVRFITLTLRVKDATLKATIPIRTGINKNRTRKTCGKIIAVLHMRAVHTVYQYPTKLHKNYIKLAVSTTDMLWHLTNCCPYFFTFYYYYIVDHVFCKLYAS